VTGIDRLFVSIGELGIFSGVYAPAVPGKIRWDADSESGPLPTRPLAIVEADGWLLFSAGKSVFRRVDGPAPAYTPVHDLGDLPAGKVVSGVGGIRGLTPIPNPAGAGQSLLFVWAPDTTSRGCVMRLDPDGAGGYTRTLETCLDSLVSEYLNGNPVYFILAGYNTLLAVENPATGETDYLIGLEAWIGSGRFPTTQRSSGGGFYAGALYAVRDSSGGYRIEEVNGRMPSFNPPLVSARAYALSPFEAEPDALYFAGYDCNNFLSPDTGWIFRTVIGNAIPGR
jgi:hypothetical protein